MRANGCGPHREGGAKGRLAWLVWASERLAHPVCPERRTAGVLVRSGGSVRLAAVIAVPVVPREPRGLWRSPGISV